MGPERNLCFATENENAILRNVSAMTHLPRPLSTLSFSTTNLRDKVLRSGYSHVGELQELMPHVLQRDLGLTDAQKTELLQQLNPDRPLRSTALELLQLEHSQITIPTGSQALDSLFNQSAATSHGLPLGCVTEICGLAGSGKTQLGLQLCINTLTSLNMHVHGSGGSESSDTTVFIDSEGSFVSSRVKMMVEAACNRLSNQNQGSGSVLPVQDILQRVQHCRVHSPVEMLAMIRQLRNILEAERDIKLIVIDSIASLFRSNFSNVQMRTKLIGLMGRQLSEMATTFNVAIVVLNHMSTKFERASDISTQLSQYQSSSSSTVMRFLDDSDQPLQPAMGETWGRYCTYRIHLRVNQQVSLYGQQNQSTARLAHMFKTPLGKGDKIVKFDIGPGGIGDVAMASATGGDIVPTAIGGVEDDEEDSYEGFEDFDFTFEADDGDGDDDDGDSTGNGSSQSRQSTKRTLDHGPGSNGEDDIKVGGERSKLRV